MANFITPREDVFVRKDAVNAAWVRPTVRLGPNDTEVKVWVVDLLVEGAEHTITSKSFSTPVAARSWLGNIYTIQ